VAGATGARAVAHPQDAPELPLSPDVLVEHGSAVTVGDCSLEVIHLRGHTPGSIALLHRDTNGRPHLFSGDSLFPGGPGKTWSAEDFTSLMNDLEARVCSTSSPTRRGSTPGTGTTPPSARSARRCRSEGTSTGATRTWNGSTSTAGSC
jgi:hypothetical protein